MRRATGARVRRVRGARVRGGTWPGLCSHLFVGVRHFTELAAWQLAAALRDQVIAFTNRVQVARDFKFCNQARDAASSAPSNIAEGFCRYSHREFAQFLKIAYGSLGEVQDHLIDAKTRGYVDQTEFLALWRQSVRASSATVALLRFVRSSDAPLPRSKRPRPGKSG